KYIEFGEVSLYSYIKIIQTSGAFDRNIPLELCLQQYAFCRTGNPNLSTQILDVQVWWQMDMGSIKLKIPTKAYGLMYNKANVKLEGMVFLIHG
ncbi:MAG: hypothetical protein GWN61_15875, partial [candidate division Zixibacteria bacterium]|nr:hypothetical protein [candidate division Zixibacteria bacterium]NIS47410.1 hypothetical protein [candidate division Zixibacteria bacterium]NIU15508.1 hypothetical protein [candidate division Zixibacteria bacterium]NIV07610.1 hypothetical protein [candidate division Zixibacteria bacterium]NIW46826.1 hypothetical protein [Gammaproteobacteria bacterium]